MKKELDLKIVVSIIFVLLILTSNIFLEKDFAQAAVSTTKTITSNGSIITAPSPSPTPTPSPTVTPTPSPTVAPTPPATGNRNNGIWTQAGPDMAPSKCSFYVSNKIKELYMQVGYWKSDCSIYSLVSAAEIRSAVANAHGVGLKVFAWVTSQVSYGDTLNIGASSLRQAAFNSMVSLVNVYGFDGMADDAEELEYSVFSDYVAYFNGATLAMHSIGKQYFSAVLTYLATNMGSSLFSQINVDRLQPMLYGYPSNQLPEVFKAHLDFFLRYSSSPVGLAVHSDGPFQTLNSSMGWIDQQFARGTPTYNLSGIDLFWFIGMNTTQWNQWSNWTTKK
jgi:hypothetical protein